MTSPLLAPLAVLVLWSVVVLFWVMLTRLPAFKKAGIDLATAPPGGRYQDLESAMPPRVNWVSHNYAHLMEQPTVYYAVVLVLAVAGDSSGLSVGLAWGYCVLRIAHSLWQGLVNTIPVRFLLFLLSTLCLAILAVRAVLLTVS